MKTPFLFLIVGIILSVFTDRSYAQTGICSSSLVQATVSNLNSQIASYMPTLSYDPANNRFVASIFNNVQVISQSQCTNLVGNSAPTPGITSFSVYLSCTGPENNGNGIIGGIQLPVTNVSTTAILNTVNIPVGSTYSSIPIKANNPNASLSNRRCVIQLQATLFAVLGNGFCQACYNVPITSINYDTGASGDSQPCEFFDLTCYNNFGILWRSTWLWCVVIIGILLIAGLCFFPVYGMIYLKRVDQVQYKEIMALKEDDGYLKRLTSSESKRLADYNNLVLIQSQQPGPSFSSPSGNLPLPPTISREIIESPTIYPSAPAAGKKRSSASRRAKQQPVAPLPPPQLITVTDEDESSESTEEEEDTSQQPLIQSPPPQPQKEKRVPATTGPSTSSPQQPVPIQPPTKLSRRFKPTTTNVRPPTREEFERPSF